MDSMGKFGYIDDAGKKKIDFIYDLALPFDNSIAEVYKNGKANFINIMGDTLSQ